MQGADVVEPLDTEAGGARMEAFAELYRCLEEIPVPTVAVCVGACVGSCALRATPEGAQPSARAAFWRGRLREWVADHPGRSLLSGYCPVESHSVQLTTIDGHRVFAGQPHNAVDGHHQPFPRDRSPAYRPARPLSPA